MLGVVLSVLVAVGGSAASAPPPSVPDEELAEGAGAPGLAAMPSEVGVGTTDFERQLAELGFIAFLARELNAAASAIACTEPPTTNDAELTCFALVDGQVVLATTAASAGTGDFTFVLVDLAPPATSEVPDSVVETSEPSGSVALTPDDAVVAYGQALQASAQESIAADLAADPRLTAATFSFDPETATSRLDLTVSDTQGFTVAEVAWVSTRGFARAHWTRTSPFRDPAATLRPGFVIVINGEQYVSDWELMSAIADERVSRASWTEQAAT